MTDRCYQGPGHSVDAAVCLVCMPNSGAALESALAGLAEGVHQLHREYEYEYGERRRTCASVLRRVHVFVCGCVGVYVCLVFFSVCLSLSRSRSLSLSLSRSLSLSHSLSLTVSAR
jgi:hypothetical protein